MSDTRIAPEDVASQLEILQLFARYCHIVDLADWPRFVDVFTDDVLADYSTVDVYTEDASVIRGLDNLIAWFEKSMAHIGPGLTHFMTNHLIELRGEDALVTVHNHVLNVGMGGVYHCRAVPTPQGWR